MRHLSELRSAISEATPFWPHEAWARLEDWWLTDIWGWVVDVPMEDLGGGHCTGRRTGKPVYCPDCDEKEKSIR